MSVADEAIELFSDRARRARPDFRVDDDNAALVEEICRRLDGMPLAIELAAARVRALSLPQIVDSLHDRFRLLTGGARTAVRRQQTLRASVDWSHALLTAPERVLFRRLAVFMGGLDLDAAQAVGASSEVERYQLLDVLTLLVDKSLVVAEDGNGAMRYRLLETVRQYALEKLGESGEADEVRSRHCDHYSAMAARLDSQGQSGFARLMLWAEVELDNLRAAFAWSREDADAETALRLVSSLHLFWITAARFTEGLAGFDAVLTDELPGRGTGCVGAGGRRPGDARGVGAGSYQPAAAARGPGDRPGTRRRCPTCPNPHGVRHAHVVQRRHGAAVLCRGDRTPPRGG